MRLEFAVSFRYLRSARDDGAISLISWIAILGIILGVAALVVAMAVMNGYQSNLLRAMAGSLPHVSVHSVNEQGFEDLSAVIKEVQRIVRPVTTASFAMQDGLVRVGEGKTATIHGVLWRGIEPGRELEISDFLALLSDGASDWDTITPAERSSRARSLLQSMQNTSKGQPTPVLLSPLLAGKMKVGLGDRLTPMKFPKAGSGFSPLPVAQELRVAGFFESGIVVFDELVVILNLNMMSRILPGKQVEMALGMRLADPLTAGAAADAVRSDPVSSRQGIYVYSWLESNRGLFQVIRIQKVMLYIVLMLIVIIAFFGMISALTMLVTEKTREIAILKSLGFGDRGIMTIFITQGVIIGVLGTVLGLGVGLSICALLANFPIIEIPPGVYPGTDKIPVLVDYFDVGAIVLGTMVVCLGATLFPARRAKNQRPADGLRFG